MKSFPLNRTQVCFRGILFFCRGFLFSDKTERRKESIRRQFSIKACNHS